MKDYVDARLNCEVGEGISAISLQSGGEVVLTRYKKDEVFMAASPSILDGVQYNYVIRDQFNNGYAVQSIDLDFDV